MKSFIMISFLLLIYLSISCSQNELKGIVIDGVTKKPLDDVSVTLIGTQISGVTNSEGEFNIQFAQTNENVENQNEAFEIFWQKFSKAVINKQKDKVISFTHFPFYSDYGFLDQQKFSNNYDWLFDNQMIKGIMNAQIGKVIDISEDESVSLLKIEKDVALKILNYLKLSSDQDLYHFKFNWVEETEYKYLQIWCDLIFIQFENTYKLVSDQNPWLGF